MEEEDGRQGQQGHYELKTLSDHAKTPLENFEHWFNQSKADALSDNTARHKVCSASHSLAIQSSPPRSSLEPTQWKVVYQLDDCKDQVNQVAQGSVCIHERSIHQGISNRVKSTDSSKCVLE